MEIDKATANLTESVENALLGGCLIGNRETVDTVFEYGLTKEHFSSLYAQQTFEIIKDLYEGGHAIDLYVVASEANKRHGKELMMYVLRLNANIYSANHVHEHCLLLHEYYIRKETTEIALEMQHSAATDEQGELLDKLRHLTDELLSKKYGTNMKHVSELVGKSEEDMHKRATLYAEGRMAGITTGLKGLDELTNGWQNSTLNVIAGRPGMGKTAIALHFALAAAKAGNSVCIYSLEMSNVRLSDRMILALADGIDPANFRRGSMTQDDVAAFELGKERLMGLPIYIDDHPVCTTNYIRANAKKMKAVGKCDLVIIDYLQLTDMTSNTSRQYNREQQVTKTSREFKILSKEIDVPVLLLSQLSRAVESRADKKPQLSDLRESGAIEQDADTVTFIFRPEYYGQEGYVVYDGNGNYLCGNAILNVSKQRDGATGEVMWSYNKSLTKIGEESDFRQEQTANLSDYNGESYTYDLPY